MTNQMMAAQWYPDRLLTPGVDWPLPSAARPTPPVKRYVVCNDMDWREEKSGASSSLSCLL